MKIINKKYTKNRGLVQITLGNKKKWIGEIIFLQNIKKFYFILPFYNLSVFKLKTTTKNFENSCGYNEKDLLFDQNSKSKVKKELSFSNYIKYIEQKKNNRINEYKKLNILKNLKYLVLVPFSNILFLKDTTNFLSSIVDYKLKMNILKKSGFNLVEIKKIFVKY